MGSPAILCNRESCIAAVCKPGHRSKAAVRAGHRLHGLVRLYLPSATKQSRYCASWCRVFNHDRGQPLRCGSQAVQLGRRLHIFRPCLLPEVAIGKVGCIARREPSARAVATLSRGAGHGSVRPCRSI